MQEIRVVDKKDRNGNPLVIGFAQFETVHQAAAALKTLQVSKQPQRISGPASGPPSFTHQQVLHCAQPLKMIIACYILVQHQGVCHVLLSCVIQLPWSELFVTCDM